MLFRSFQFAEFPSLDYLLPPGMTGLLPAGFPHSDICGSLDICSSPQLFAAYHVFLRLLVPRHSPRALSSLTFCFFARSLSWAAHSVGLSFLTLFRCLSLFCLSSLCFSLPYVVFKVPFSSFSQVPLRLETERFELLTPCLQGRRSEERRVGKEC